MSHSLLRKNDFLSIGQRMDVITNTLPEKRKKLGNLLNTFYVTCKFVDLNIETPSRHDKLDLLEWCQENFENNWIWKFNTFYFLNEEDSMMFLLRYGDSMSKSGGHYNSKLLK